MELCVHMLYAHVQPWGKTIFSQCQTKSDLRIFRRRPVSLTNILLEEYIPDSRVKCVTTRQHKLMRYSLLIWLE